MGLLNNVGEDSNDDSQYETADESESDMELKPKAGNENNPIDSTTGLMGSEVEKKAKMDKMNLKTQTEDTTEQASSKLNSLTLQLKIKDEEIDRLKSANKNLMKEITKQTERVASFRKRLLDLVAEDNENSTERKKGD